MAFRRRPKQQTIEGTQPEADPELDQIVDEYVELRDQRIDASAAETKAKKRLLGALAARQIKHHETADGTVVDLVPTDEKLKVKAAKSESNDDDENELDDDEVG